MVEKHPSFGWTTKEEFDAILNAPSPTHRKAMKKELGKTIKARLKKKEKENGPKH
jgi:hypothetical protein